MKRLPRAASRLVFAAFLLAIDPGHAITVKAAEASTAMSIPFSLDGVNVRLNQAGYAYPTYYDGRASQYNEGGVFTSALGSDPRLGMTLEMNVTAGQLYAQWNPYSANARGFARDYSADPQAWSFNTYKRLVFWIKTPPTSPGLNGDEIVANYYLGTYVKRVANPDESSDEAGGAHFYHDFAAPNNGRWTKVIINMHPDHNRGGSGNTDWGVQEHPTGEPAYNYWDALTRFYISHGGTASDDYPAGTGVTSIAGLHLEEYPYPENDGQIYGLSANYDPGANRLIVAWQRHKDENTVRHEVRYLIGPESGNPHGVGWNGLTAAPGGSVTPQGWQGYNGMVYDTTAIPGISSAPGVWIAVKPENSSLFSTIYARNFSVNPADLPRLTAQGFREIGAFRVPNHGETNYAHGTIEYNPARGSLFLVGHDQRNFLGEISIPATLSTSSSLGALPTATLLQGFKDVLGVLPNNSDLAEKIGGLLYLDGKLYGAGYEYYDADGNAVKSHFIVDSPGDLANTAVRGLFAFDVGEPGFAQYMSPIPGEWQAELGGAYLTGASSGEPIITRWSIGPSALVFDPAKVGTVNPVPTTKLLLYDGLSHAVNGDWNDLDNHSGNNGIWTHLSRAVYGFIVPGTRTFLAIGHSGGHVSGVCYKCTATCGVTYGGYGPIDCDDQGAYYWAYDVNDLVAVKEGRMDSWSVRPYEYGPLPLRVGPGDTLGGASFDPATGRLYVAQTGGDTQAQYTYLPVIHVFQFNSVPPSLSVAITGPANGATVSGSVTVQVAAAAGANPIDHVELHKDGQLFGIDGAAPYSFSWNTASTANGSHNLQARVYDSQGNQAQHSISVTVQNGHAAPPDLGAFIPTPNDPWLPNLARNPTIYSNTSAGNWSDPSSWSPARLPTASDIVAISPGDTITVDTPTAAADRLGIHAGGALKFSRQNNPSLLVTTLMVYPNGALELGTPADPIPADKTAQIVIANKPVDTALDPGQYGNGIVALGKVTMHGAAKTPFMRLAAEPRAGDTTLSLASAVTGWRTGDKIYLPDSKQWYSQSWAYAVEYETATVSAVSSDGKTITLQSALKFNHPGARNGDDVLEFLPHAVNYTRNAGMRSQSASGTRGYVMFTHRADVDIRYAQFNSGGRTNLDPINNTVYSAGGAATSVGTNQDGRYPVFFNHLMGPTSPQANGRQYTFIGNSVFCGLGTHRFAWGVTLNDSHYGLLKDNVSYNWAGANFATMSGNETENILEGNIAVRGRGEGGRQGSNRMGTEAMGFWFRGPNNRVRDNVAANFHGDSIESEYGYKFGFTYLGDIRVPKGPGKDTSVAGEYDVKYGNALPLLEFASNEVYGVENGFTMWWVNATDTRPENGGQTVVKDIRIWHVSNYGFYGYPMNDVIFDGFVMRGDKGALFNVHEFLMGIWFGDYMTKGFVLRNADIQGARTGFVDPYFGGTDDAGTTSVIENSYFRNATNIVTRTIGAPGSGGYGPARKPKSLIVRNVRFGSTAGWNIGQDRTQQNLGRWYTTHDGSGNLVKSDTMFVYDYNGVAGDNFQVFYNEQSPDFVMPQTGGNLDACPSAGLTNAQCWAQHGKAIAGAVLPAGTTTLPMIYGQVLDLPPGSTPPSFTGQPAARSVAPGQTATFSVSVTGTAPFTYQWKKNGADISGANGPSYTTPAAVLNDNGARFRCVVGNSAGSAVSDEAVLAVENQGGSSPPSITQQPASATVGVGQAADFTAAATGTSPMTFQWQMNGSDIPGATASTYNTPAAVLSDSGAKFRCVVANAFGSATSNEATLTVLAVPPRRYGLSVRAGARTHNGVYYAMISSPTLAFGADIEAGSGPLPDAVALIELPNREAARLTPTGAFHELTQAIGTLSEGVHSFVLRTLDAGGGTLYQTPSISVTVLRTPPEAPAFGGFNTTDKVQLSFGGAPIAAVHWTIARQSGTAGVGALSARPSAGTASMTTTGGTLSLQQLGMEPGVYQITAVAEDPSGNLSAQVQANVRLMAWDLSAARVYPNPWRADRHAGHAMTFDQISPNATIKIFNAAGQWVRTLTAVTGSASWDLRTDGGDAAASGVYLYLITDDQDGKAKGKLALIR